MKDKKCVVVGGGKVAERKVTRLLESQAKVVVVSPDLTPGLDELRKRGEIEHQARSYQEDDLEEAFLVISAADKRDVNERVSREACGKTLLVNVVDAPELSNCFVPSIVRRGDLLISISTGGIAPGLAKRIRTDLERLYGKEYDEYLKILAQFREKVKEKHEDQAERYLAWQRILDSDLLERIRKGETVSVEEFV